MNRSFSRYFSPARLDSLSPIGRSETRITFAYGWAPGTVNSRERSCSVVHITRIRMHLRVYNAVPQRALFPSSLRRSRDTVRVWYTCFGQLPVAVATTRKTLLYVKAVNTEILIYASTIGN